MDLWWIGRFRFRFQTEDPSGPLVGSVDLWKNFETGSLLGVSFMGI